MFLPILALSLNSASGQTPGQTLAFEVASITPCAPGTPAPAMEHAGAVQFVFPGGRFQAKATTLKALIEWAYEIQPAQHSKGPGWVETDRYDVEAKAEGNATMGEMRLMVRTLLAERFKLRFHYEKKDLPVYVLSLGKKAPNLFSPKDGEEHALKMGQQAGSALNPNIVIFHVTATRYSLTQLADTISRQMDRTMLNETGLDGEFDFTLDLEMDASQPRVLDPAMLITSMREQLGLVLKAQNHLMDFLAIDSADKVNAGN